MHKIILLYNTLPSHQYRIICFKNTFNKLSKKLLNFNIKCNLLHFKHFPLNHSYTLCPLSKKLPAIFAEGRTRATILVGPVNILQSN